MFHDFSARGTDKTLSSIVCSSFCCTLAIFNRSCPNARGLQRRVRKVSRSTLATLHTARSQLDTCFAPTPRLNACWNQCTLRSWWLFAMQSDFCNRLLDNACTINFRMHSLLANNRILVKRFPFGSRVLGRLFQQQVAKWSKQPQDLGTAQTQNRSIFGHLNESHPARHEALAAMQHQVCAERFQEAVI